jgi:hypothetical protein
LRHSNTSCLTLSICMTVCVGIFAKYSMSTLARRLGGCASLRKRERDRCSNSHSAMQLRRNTG